MSKSSIQKYAFHVANEACYIEPMANHKYRVVCPSQAKGFIYEGPTCSYNIARSERARSVAVHAMELLGYNYETIKHSLPIYLYGSARFLFNSAIKVAGPVKRA